MLRVDELNINGYKIYQDPSQFCFGVDAVFLAAEAQVKKTDRVIDICSGSGIIPLLLLARGDVENITMVEYFDYFCDLAKKSAELNGCEDRLSIVNADIKEIEKHFKKSSFDVLTVNPPYEKNGHGIDSPNPMKNAARRETLCDIRDVCRAASYLLETGGRMYMIHRPSRICDILCAMREFKIEPRTLKLVQSKQGSEPNMVLISGIKGAPPYLTVQKNMIIYNDDGSYTEESSRLYNA